MRAYRFAYPAALAAAEEGGFVVSFRDVPEAITQGDDEAEALSEGVDALDEAIAARIKHGDDIPPPSPVKHGERLVAVPALTAAQAVLYLAMREQGVTKSELARRLGTTPREAARLTDPRHPSKIARIEAALAVLGHALEVGSRKVA
ncbi:MAG TPA: type II toxin-antitoxin system HicB family antitoxin [Alphaproteobacteria bacterium]|nr:type II toxin-antitoxin system HicB family antitoxin [Alphaproteobacteria bacterium]